MLKACLLFLVPIVLAAQAPGTLRVEGLVQGPGGRPLTQAVVALNPIKPASGLFEPQVRRTTAQGRFTLEGVPGQYGLTVTAQGCLPCFQYLTLAPGQAPPLAIRLGAGHLPWKHVLRLEKGRIFFILRGGLPKGEPASAITAQAAGSTLKFLVVDELERLILIVLERSSNLTFS